MATEKSSLRIKAERLGNILDVVSFLTDLENAYNSIYAFEFIVDSLSNERLRRFGGYEERYNRFKKLSKEFQNRKEFLHDPFLYELIFEEFTLNRLQEGLPNLLELQSRIHIEKVVLPSDRLYISKVTIQSPGFWEVLGNFIPLQQIREGLKDHHERKKDNKYRSRQEEEKGELDIIEKRDAILSNRIDTLRKLGYSDIEIRQLVTAMIVEPLNKLTKHQDNGQIEGTE